MKRLINNRILKLYSLQFLIAIACIVVSILPMTYTGFSVYTKYAKQLVTNSDVFANQIMDQLKINIEEYIRSGIKINNDIGTIIEDQDRMIDSALIDRLNVYYATRNDIISIAITDSSGHITTTIPQREVKEGYGLGKEAWFEDLINGDMLYFISEPHVQNMHVGEHEWVISIYKTVDVVANNRSVKNILKVDISIKALDEICNNLNLGGSGYVYLTNNKKEIIYHPQQALIFSGQKIEEPYSSNSSTTLQTKNEFGDEVLTLQKSIGFVDWNLIGVTYIKDIFESNSRIAQEVLAAIPLILVIIILLSWYISGRITEPIKALEKKMHKVQMGDLETQIDLENGEKEVVELGKSFNVMVQKIKVLVDENQQEHEAKRISELNALQAQINPHFLYNTLDSIMWMAESNLNEEVVEMVTALARLFRISISKGRNIITVKEEVEHARNYLLIQKIRYKDKFSFEIEVPDQLQLYQTPKLILQPIIENAIYHGIEYMVDEGHIHIRAFSEGDMLIFEIKDNGLGMDEETIQNLLFREDYIVEPHQGSGVGVRNVDERIKLRYGRPYGIGIQSEIEVGTTVQLRIPLIGGDILE